MKHATSDSDVTSLATSPPKTPTKQQQQQQRCRPAYYVQSPSRDSSSHSHSHDGYGDTDKASQLTTPVYNNSPLESPSHPSSSTTGRHSRISSSLVTRYSGFLRSSSSPAAAAARKKNGWREVIDEEAAYDDEEPDDDGGEEMELPSALACFFSVLALLFVVACLIVWGAARHSKPSVVVKSLAVHNLYVGEGTDITGVPTKLVTLNCSLTMSVHNPSKMFGIHVSSVFTRLMYLEISVADGRFDKFYQGRTSHHAASVVLHGEKTPLYGAGATLGFSNTGGGTVPLMLDMVVRTRGYVIGNLVRVTHKRHVKCLAVIDSGSCSSKPVRFRQSACTYS